MIDGIQALINAIQTIIDGIQMAFAFLINIVKSLFMLIELLINIVINTTTLIATLPPWLIAFATATLSVSVLYIILGRDTGK